MSDKYTWSDVKYSDSGLMNAAKMLGLANLNFSSGLLHLEQYLSLLQ